MKQTALRIVILLLVTALTAAFSVPVTADTFPVFELDEYDQEMLLSFWQQSAYDGLTNGEAVYDIHLGENGFLSQPAPEYDGSYWTHMLSSSHIGNEVVFNFYLYYYLSGWDGSSGEEGESPMVTVHPDLYGPLDLHGTNIAALWGDGLCSTHLNDIDLDDCPYLGRIMLQNQTEANTLSAMNCPLNWIDTEGSTFRSIEYTIARYEEPMHISSTGNGSVAVYYVSAFTQDVTRLTAASQGEMFLGWYIDDELISAEPEIEVTEGGNYCARFGGDADGDGTISVSDALRVLRICMGLSSAGSYEVDVNCNGTVDTADALIILRFAMGLL